MKRFLSVITLCIPLILQAQENWQPMLLTVSGHHEVNGVSAFYQLSDCGDENYILLRFENSNNFAVEVSWYDGVFTQDKQWIRHHGEAAMKKIILEAHSTHFGFCGRDSLLKVLLKDFIPDKSSFYQYKALELVINIK